MNAYVFDTSSLVEAWVRAYPPDSFPQLWMEMEGLADDGRLISPEEVLIDLAKKDDDLHAWVKSRSTAIIQPTSRELMDEVKEILSAHPMLTKSGTGRNASDPFVIALAAIRECPVVTQEKGGTDTKPKIPSVCSVRSLDCMTILEVIRSEGWVF